MSEHLDEIELRSEEVKDILTKVPPWLIRSGSMIFLLLIILVFSLSWIIKYPDVIRAEAVLTTQTPPQKEYAKISGKIDDIYVVDNQTVQKSKVLAILENAADQKDVFLLKSILDTLIIDKENVFFPFEVLPVLFLGDIEADFAQFENNYFQYSLNRDLNPFSNEALANEVSLLELRKRLRSASSQQTTIKNELDFKKKNLARNEILFKKGIISALAYENKQLEHFTAQKNYQNVAITLSQLRETLSNMDHTSNAAHFNRKREETRLLKYLLQSYNQLIKSVREWEMKYVFKSNIDGKVSFLNYWNKNQTVHIGDLVLTILPNNNSAYVVKLQTPSVNSGKIKIGQKVNVSLYDYPEYEFGVIQGKVTSISATSDQQGTYLVNVSVPTDLTTSYGKQIIFKQEMKGEAAIIMQDLRLSERIFYQFRGLFNNH